MKDKLLLIFFGLVLVKSLFWLVLTPIFQVPDEPSHFSIVQFIAENGRRPHPRREVVTSRELLTVSSIVNFNWDIVHPVWQGYQSGWQEKISAIAATDRSDFIHNSQQKSLKRPPLYYWLATPVYLLFKSQPFLWRFFSVRFFSIIINLATVWLSYLTAKLIFKQKLLSLAVAALVAFQPTLSFISIGVHYDPLAVLVTTGFLYTGVNYLQSRKKIWWRYCLFLAIAGVLIKPDLIVLLFSLIFLLKTSKLKLILPLVIVVTAVIALLPPLLSSLVKASTWYSDKLLYLTNLNEYAYLTEFFYKSIFSGKIFIQLKDYLIATGSIHLAQVFPWYWGVFGWLEATLPLLVYRLIKLVVLVSLIGLVWFFLKLTKIPQILRRQVTFLVLVAFFHLMTVILNDFKIFTTTGQIYGIQGRYLLMPVVAHMILLVLGLKQLVTQKHYRLLAGLLIAASLTLNLIGLYTAYQFFGWVWS